MQKSGVVHDTALKSAKIRTLGLGMIDHRLPSHRSTKPCSAAKCVDGEKDEPTATQSFAVRHTTAFNELYDALVGLGLDKNDHAPLPSAGPTKPTSDPTTDTAPTAMLTSIRPPRRIHTPSIVHFR
jgi:hypothetical protein